MPKIQRGKVAHQSSELGKKHTHLGKYLYEEGRCAVAHAYGNPIVTPDRTADLYRLADALAVMKALAEYIIVNEFGVDNFMSNSRKRHQEWLEIQQRQDGDS